MIQAAGAKLAMSFVTARVKWFYAFRAGHTRVAIIPDAVDGFGDDVLPVHDDGAGIGLLRFALATASARAVELTRIDVDFAAPLRFRNPGSTPFFSVDLSEDRDLPFRVHWEGTALLRRDQIQLFALLVRFEPPSRESQVRVTIHAKREHVAWGGFRQKGREHVTPVLRRLQLVEAQTRGITIPPHCGATSPQPFVIQCAFWAQRDSGVAPAPVIVHELLNDDSTSTQRIEV